VPTAFRPAPAGGRNALRPGNRGGFAGVLRVRLSLRDRVAGPAIRKEPRMATTEAEYLATWHEPSGTFPTRNGPGKWVTH